MNHTKIKDHLKVTKITSRSSTINGVFAQAIAPRDDYDLGRITVALQFLGQDIDTDLRCVFCNDAATTWDHLTGMVKDGELRGFGHQIGNLAPCCGSCNSAKGSKSIKDFIDSFERIKFDRRELIDLLTRYQNTFASEIELTLLDDSEDYRNYIMLRDQIIELMKKADALAGNIRPLLKIDSIDNRSPTPNIE
jgi:hypothetical protein